MSPEGVIPSGPPAVPSAARDPLQGSRETRAGFLAALGMTGSRLLSIDLIRGAVMVLMAIDHVRVYSGLPPTIR